MKEWGVVTIGKHRNNKPHKWLKTPLTLIA